MILQDERMPPRVFSVGPGEPTTDSQEALVIHNGIEGYNRTLIRERTRM